MRAGRLDKKIQVQRYVSSRDANGGVVKGWSFLAALWAEVRQMTGNELIQAQQIEARAQYKITLRANGVSRGITTQNRIQYKDQVINILSVVNVREQNRQIEILGEAVL